MSGTKEHNTNFFQHADGEQRDPIVDFARGMFNWQVSVIHIDSGVGASFPAFVTDYSETFQSDWNEDNYFGRNDKIGRFAGTSRTINLSLDLPSYSAEEARLNMHQIEHLTTTMYPSYEEPAPGVNVMKSYPLVKVKFANLIRNSNVANSNIPIDSGLTGWIPSLSINPDLEAGFHGKPAIVTGVKGEEPKGGILYPKVWKISFSLRVVHEHKMGWKDSRWISKSRKFPYGAYKGFTENNTDYGTAMIDQKVAEEVAKKALDRIFSGEGII